MPLVTSWVSVYKETAVIPENGSNFYVVIPSSLLSEPYELVGGDMIKGEILELLAAGTERTEFRNCPITFILKVSVGFDNLFVEKSEWQTKFRDRGLVLPNYHFKVRLVEAISKVEGKAIKLYPQRDFRFDL